MLTLRPQALLQFICATAQHYGTSKLNSRTFLSFYAVLLCEVLQAAPRVDEDLVALLLPHLLVGIGAGASADLRPATMMVLSQLSAKATLADGFLSGKRPPRVFFLLEENVRASKLLFIILLTTPFTIRAFATCHHASSAAGHSCMPMM